MPRKKWCAEGSGGFFCGHMGESPRARETGQSKEDNRTMQENKTDALGTEPIGKLLVKLAAPAIAAQIINLLYNLVDRMYIGHIQPTDTVGKLALTGVGVCLPLIMIISAFAALVAMGGAPRASIFLGKGEKERAERILGNCVTLVLVSWC